MTRSKLAICALGCLLVLVLAPSCTRPQAPSLGLRPYAPSSLDSESSQNVPAPLLKTKPRRYTGAEFDSSRAMVHARRITEFGVRPGGSAEESRAAAYIANRLRALGYRVNREFFELPNGKTSQNVWVVAKGHSSARQVIIGAHFDTRPTTPGANDNASGCGVALEIARLLKRAPAGPAVKIVFFGTEEFISEGKDEHHLGSRYNAGQMRRSEVDNTAAMISLDMVGYGSEYLVRTMGKGPRSLSDHLLKQARALDVPLEYRRDPGPTGWSDHEPYELRGIPAVWMQWLQDPTYHSMGDNAQHLRKRPFETTGEFVMSFLRGLDQAELERLCSR